MSKKERELARKPPEWKAIFGEAYKFADPEPNWRDEAYRKAEAEFAADFIVSRGCAAQNEWREIKSEADGPTTAGNYTVVEAMPNARFVYDVVYISGPKWYCDERDFLENPRDVAGNVTEFLAWMPIPDFTPKPESDDCGYACGHQEPYGFVPEAECPVHDTPKNKKKLTALRAELEGE